MPYPLNLSSFSPLSSSPKKKLSPGVYSSVITAIEDVDGYEDANAAFKVLYELCDAKGNTFSHAETFINSSNNPRTKKLLDYLADNDILINDAEELIGLKENVSLKFSVTPSSGRAFLNIVSRKLLTDSETEVDA